MHGRKAAKSPSGVPALTAERLLLLLVFFCLLALASERLYNMHVGNGIGSGSVAHAAVGDACFARPNRAPQRTRQSWTAAAATAFTAAERSVRHTRLGQPIAAEDGTAPQAEPVGRLGRDRVVAVLREVINTHDVATLLHYPCGDMGWAGPIIAAVQVRACATAKIVLIPSAAKGVSTGTCHAVRRSAFSGSVAVQISCVDGSSVEQQLAEAVRGCTSAGWELAGLDVQRIPSPQWGHHLHPGRFRSP